jgi:hypothetical protein
MRRAPDPSPMRWGMQHLQRACQGHVGYSKPVWVESEPGDGEGGPGIGEGEPGKPDDEVKDDNDTDDEDRDDKVSLLTFRFDIFSSQRTYKIHRTITFLLVKTGQRISVELLYDTEEYKAKFCVGNRKFWCQTWRMSVSSSYKMYPCVRPNQKALNTATMRLLY